MNRSKTRKQQRENDQQPGVRPVERLFPFALRARLLIVGRELLARSRSNLHFILITDDLSENSRSKLLSEYSHYPVVQHYTGEELETLFGIKGAKVVGFKKSDLAQALYAGLKTYRINSPRSGEPHLDDGVKRPDPAVSTPEDGAQKK